jgi:hypothetical protein
MTSATRRAGSRIRAWNRRRSSLTVTAISPSGLAVLTAVAATRNAWAARTSVVQRCRASIGGNAGPGRGRSWWLGRIPQCATRDVPQSSASLCGPVVIDRQALLRLVSLIDQLTAERADAGGDSGSAARPDARGTHTAPCIGRRRRSLPAIDLRELNPDPLRSAVRNGSAQPPGSNIDLGRSSAIARRPYGEQFWHASPHRDHAAP